VSFSHDTEAPSNARRTEFPQHLCTATTFIARVHHTIQVKIEKKDRCRPALMKSSKPQQTEGSRDLNINQIDIADTSSQSSKLTLDPAQKLQ